MAAPELTYVDFVPAHNLVEETDKNTLVVDLSAGGFKKEHLRVQIDDYGRLRISGERQLKGKKWSRFRKEFDVPDSCNAGDIRARFDKDGVLHITMPMLSPAKHDAGHGTARLAFGSVWDRSKMVRTLLLAAALALVSAAGLYARYRLMDPMAETASADDHTVGLSDY